jgi:hypothetical protein
VKPPRVRQGINDQEFAGPRARKFFGEKTPLPLIQEQVPFALVYDAHGTMLRLSIVKHVHPAG